MISQGWSLGTELFFYLLAPLIVKQKNSYLVTYIILFFCLRFIFVAEDFPFFPIQQRACFFELTEFMAGILSHRLYMTYEDRYVSNDAFKKTAFFLFYAIVLFLMLIHRYITPPMGSNIPHDQIIVIIMSGCITLLFSSTLPFIFFCFKNSKWDRYLGELSYPIYLWHILIAFTLGGLFPGKFDVSILLVSVICLSILTIHFVDVPLNRFRNKLLIRQNNSGTNGGLRRFVIP